MVFPLLKFPYKIPWLFYCTIIDQPWRHYSAGGKLDNAKLLTISGNDYKDKEILTPSPEKWIININWL